MAKCPKCNHEEEHQSHNAVTCARRVMEQAAYESHRRPKSPIPDRKF